MEKSAKKEKEPKIVLEWDSKCYTIEGEAERVEEIYSIAKTIDASLNASRIILLYKDEEEEDEWVKVETQEEFESALKFAQIEENEFLHFFVVDKGYEKIDEKEETEEEDEFFVEEESGFDFGGYEMVVEDAPVSENEVQNFNGESKSSRSKKTDISESSNQMDNDEGETNKRTQEMLESLAKPRKKLKMTEDLLTKINKGQYPKRNNFDSSVLTVDDYETRNLSYEMLMMKKYFDFKLQKVHERLSERARSLEDGQKSPKRPKKVEPFESIDNISRIESRQFSVNDSAFGMSIIHNGDITDQNLMLSGIWKNPDIESQRSTFFTNQSGLTSDSPQQQKDTIICDDCEMNMENIKGYKFYCVEKPHYIFCYNCLIDQNLKNPHLTFRRLQERKDSQGEKSLISKSQFHKTKISSKFSKNQIGSEARAFDLSMQDYNAKAECNDFVTVVDLNSRVNFKLKIQNIGDKTFPKNTLLVNQSDQTSPNSVVQGVSLPRLRPYEVTDISLDYKFEADIDELAFNFYAQGLGFFGNVVILDVKIDGRPPHYLTHLLFIRCRSFSRPENGKVAGNRTLRTLD